MCERNHGKDDFDLLVRHYLDDEKEWLERVLDPAAFCAHVYGCEGGSGSSVIGLGIARDGLYPDYGLTSATKQFWFDFWKETIQMIEASGYEWQIFGNGLYQDYLFELEVLEYVGKAKEVSRYLAGARWKAGNWRTRYPVQRDYCQQEFMQIL